ncbi:MAG: lamin tail domain-containing protein [Melioribacteraceae bacterium]|nr:MAG: lamin tail domain-containing protein [Melioribacteraceae bacterium]
MIKKLSYLLMLLFIASVTYSQVFISEYLEGSSNNKAVEIFNGGTTAVDLSNYRFVRANNGSPTLQDSLVLAGTLNPGDVYVLANASAITAILDSADTTGSIAFFNGDDYVGLQENQGGNWVTIDAVGKLGEDPGTAWPVAGIANATAEHTLVRKSSVNQGNTNWTASAGTDSTSSEWLVYPQNDVSYIGWHTMNPPTSYPNIFFSEYIEGGSNRKALEIYNPDTDSVDLASIQIAQATNGGGWQFYHVFPAGAKIAPGDVWVIVAADDYSSVSYDTTDADEVLPYPSVVHHNGDDARALIYIDGVDTTFIDIIGTPDSDPGSGWTVAGIANATQNHTLVRKAAVTVGNTDWTASAGTDTSDSEWIVYNQDIFTYLGIHPGAVQLPDPEPSEHVTNLSSTAGENNIELAWTDAGGAQLPAGYLILINTTGTFTDPIDGTPVADDNDYSDNAGAQNVAQGVQMFNFTGLTPETEYFFQIYPYSNSDVEIDYKTDGSVPAIADTTLEDVVQVVPNIFFSEYIEGGSNRKALEIFNISSEVVSLANVQIAQSVNGGGWQYYHSFPSGASINPGGVWVIITNDDFTGYFDAATANEILPFPSVVHFNGDDARALIFIDGPDTTFIDVIGVATQDPGSGWAVAGVSNATQNHTLVRKSFIEQGNTSWSSSAGTNSSNSEWIVYDQDVFDHLGIHAYAEAPDMPPVVSDVFRDNYVPYEDEPVTITAMVTDDNNILSSIILYYSVNGVATAKENIIQTEIPMTAIGNNYYSATISADVYADGDYVEYYIVAIDEPVKGQKDTSATGSFFVGITDIRDVKVADNNVRPQYLGVGVRIIGTATVPTGTFHPTRFEAYIQDSTAGIGLFNSALTTPIVTGKRYVIVGRLDFYNGLMQISPQTESDILDLGSVGQVEPSVVTIGEILADPEYYEGMLIRLNGVSLDASTPWQCSGSGANLTFTSNGEQITVRIDADTDICGAEEPTWPVDLLGVVGQFDPSSPYSEGYQVLPRSLDDFLTPTDVDEEEIPLTYGLEQNYPNPFNPSTTIKFSIPEQGLVTLKVYNLLGEEVITLINNQLEAAYHEVKFDASQLGSGVYFYRITSGDFVSTKKMLLIK